MSNAAQVLMPKSEVQRIATALAEHKINFWIDGGWGVDALLHEQTRPHKDLDICISIENTEEALQILEALGYSVTRDERPSRLIMFYGEGRRIDIHLLTFDEHGNGRQRYNKGYFTYPAEGMSSIGEIGNLTVKCLSPEQQVSFRALYEPDEKSKHDVAVLTRRFNIKKSASSRPSR